jgi:hypothetical protein
LLGERHRDRVKREDRRAGEIIAILYNINRDSEKDPKGIDWQDVFLEWKEEPKEQTEEEMLALMQLFATKSNEGLSH